MLFVLLGSMMVVIPMLIEQVNARTESRASGGVGGHEPPFTNVFGKLEKGKWKVHPRVTNNGQNIEWVTVGSGVFGGIEFGHVTADYESHKVTFTWFNPDRLHEPLGCNVKWTGNAVGWCTILSDAGVTSGPFAWARFYFDTNCNIFKCQENGSNSQNVRFDDLLKHGGIHFHFDIHHPDLSGLDELHR